MGPEHARGGRDLLVQCYAPADLEALASGRLLILSATFPQRGLRVYQILGRFPEWCLQA